MKSYNTYYSTQDEFKEYIAFHGIADNPKLLIQIFTALTVREKLEALLQEIVMLFPSAAIIGASTDGEICSGKVSTGQTVVSLTQFEKTELHTTFVENCTESFRTGKALASALSSPDAKLIITFTDGLHCNGAAYLRGITAIDKQVIVAGGLAGDNAQFSKTYVFTRDILSSNGAVGVALINPTLFIHTDYSFNWLPIGKRMTITRADRNRIYTIDDLSAYEVYERYLGSDVAAKLPAIGVEFPLIIQKKSGPIARAVLVDHKDGSLSFGGDFEVGDSVTFGYGDVEMILNHSIGLHQEIATKPVESIYIYSCMARRRFMPNLIENEIEPLQRLANVSGFFTYSEFFSFGESTELLNQTMTIVGISESEEITQNKKPANAKESPLNEYQKSIKSLSHLLNVTIRELAEENQILEEKTHIIEAKSNSLHLAQKVGHFGSWEIDLVNGRSIWSEESYRIYKLDPKTTDPTLDTFLGMVIDEDKQKVMTVMKSLEDGESKRTQIRARRSDGVIITLLMNGKMLFDKDHKASKIVGTTIDITEMVSVEHKQKQQAQILEQIHDSVVSTDLDGNIIHWNHGASTMHGYSSEEMIGESIEKLYLPEDLVKVRRIKEEVLKEGVGHSQIRKVTKAGTIIFTDVSLSVLKNEQGKVVGITRYSQDITQKKEIEDKLKKQTALLNHQAYYDPLTQLPNRALFDDRLQQSIVNAQRKEEKFGLLFIDLDNFKQINDTMGHHYGDEVLKIIARRLSACIRGEDSLSRLGGDEFTILAQELKKPESAAKIAQKVIDAMKSLVTVGNHEFHLSASIGISLYPQDSILKNDLLKYADTAMYKAKEEGRDTYRFYSAEMTKMAFEKAVMERSLHQAIEKREFVVYYQPQIDVRNGTLVGMEALVRWQHPEFGLLMPDKFIALAEETGLIKELDNIVMYQAMTDISQWYKEGLNPGILSLNLSIKQMMNPHFLQTLRRAIMEIRFDVKWLEFEITESQMMQDPLKSIAVLQEISTMGIEIAIDDFGTGYSSLAYLKRLPVNKLKIDRSFIQDLPHDDEDRAITRAVIALAQSLNLSIIAEGVENREQLDYLNTNGCYTIQGYYYSKAIPREEMSVYIEAPFIAI